METVMKQSCVACQRLSLIEFLLGDRGCRGWLDAYTIRNPDIGEPAHSASNPRPMAA